MTAPGFVALVVLAGLCMGPSTAAAQPWGPGKGEGAVSVLYQHLYVERHVFGNGANLDVGHIRSQALALDIDFGVTDRLSIGATLPFVASRYTGSRPHTHLDGHTADDGRYHSGLQDVRMDVRYNIVTFPVAITPFVAVNLPSHDYEYFAHSAIGLNMKEVQVGVAAGLARSSLYVQGRYAFGQFEQVLDVRRRRSSIDTEVGWFATPRLRLFAFETGQISHGGIDILPGFVGLTSEQIEHHDQIGRANILDVGVGTSLGVTPTVDVLCAVLRTVAGANAHATKYGVTVGVSISFSTRQ